MSKKYRYAYIHGFASSPRSKKGQYLAEAFRRHGYELHLPELNQPSFQELTYTAALGALDKMDVTDERPWRLIGSSMGGYLAVRWAAMNPDRVDRMVLLCPGFNLGERWPHLVGERRMKRWEREKKLSLPGPTGEMEPLHWRFIEDALQHPAFPDAPCTSMIIHGRRDLTVPVESSRRYAETRENVEVYEVDDNHGLIQSVEYISQRIFLFFDISSQSGPDQGSAEL